MIVLGIETSCDETAAALVDDERRVLAQRLVSQHEDHRPFGGIVPEIAARSHLDHLDTLVSGACRDAGVDLGSIDAVAATAGPGLIGGVLVGLMTGKAIAAAIDRPFIAVNHLEGHALSVRLVGDVTFPYLLLLVSGGHCMFTAVEGVGRYRTLGATVDDAAGEAFDKTAKMLGLGYPGGPAIETWAARGDPQAVPLPRPMHGRPGCDLSFAGLKTAVHNAIAARTSVLDDGARADLAASVQAAIVDSIASRAENAMAAFLADHPGGGAFVLSGGVAANRALRERVAAVAMSRGLAFSAPPAALCTDNAAMIAWAGIERRRLGLADSLDAPARPRWALDSLAAAS